MTTPTPRAGRADRAARPEIIATDLDGTLLRSDGTVSPRTRETLARAEDAGLCIVFVTGRPPRWMESLTEVIGRHGVAICSNGGAVYDVRRKEIQESFPLRAEDALAAVEALRAGLPGVSFAFEYPGGFSREPGYPVQMWDQDRVERIAEAEEILGAADSHGVFKVLAKHPDLDPDEFLRRGRALTGDLAEVTRSAPIALLELSASGVSKATTLATWCAERGVGPERVAAVGDMPNDLPMLAWAGHAYAVANAHPEVLAATGRAVPSNDQDGVAVLIEELLAGRDG